MDMRAALSAVTLAGLAGLACHDSTGPKDVRPANAVDVVVNFCLLPPAWLAVKNDGYEWTAVPTSGFATQFQLPVTPKVTLAYGFANQFEPGWSEVHVFSTTADELADMICGPPSGINQVSATVAGVSASDFVSAYIGPGLGYLPTGLGTMTFIAVPNGLQDLVAMRRPGNSNTPSSFIVRHDVQITNRGVLNTLDFGSAEAVSPLMTMITSPGASGQARSQFITNRGTVAQLTEFGFLTDSAPLALLPASVVTPGDGFAVSVSATGRYATRYFTTPAPQTIALGPALVAPTVTTLASTPSLLMRAEWPSQAEYPKVAMVTYQQGSFPNYKTLSVVVTAGYLGGTPTTWSVDVPDLTKVITKDLLLDANATTTWTVEAWDARMPLFFSKFGANDGETVRCATASNGLPLTSCRSPISELP